jgi:hypothetical protein
VKISRATSVALTVTCLAAVFAPTAFAEKMTVTIPSPNGGDPVVAVGEYVRRAASQDAVVVVGYRTAADSIGGDWMLLEVGVAPAPDTSPVLKREDIRLILPDGTVVPLPTQEEFGKAYPSLRGLDARANIQRDSLNYLPAYANLPCRIGFFTDVANPGRGLAYDQVSLNPSAACFGRLYFPVPGGIQESATYVLAVQFPNSDIQVPLYMMTKDELKQIKQAIKEKEQEAKEQKKAGEQN